VFRATSAWFLVAMMAASITPSRTARAASSAPTAARAADLSEVYGAALAGDMAKALAILDSLDVSRLSPKDSTARECLKRTFANPPVLEDLPPRSRRILNAYRLYWQDSMLRRATTAQAEHALLDSLRGILGIPPSDTTAATLDDASERARLAIGEEHLFALTGVTQPYYELMIWREQAPTTYHVKLPERTIQVHVVFLDRFVSLGWAGYATCGRAHSGGWATKDSLFALKSAYDLKSENFRVSYLAHEGRHFSDYGRFPKLEQPELEYRAKLTELAMSDATTYDLMVAFARLNGPDRSIPHQFANYWVARDMSRAVFKSDTVVDDAGRWRSIPADRIRHEARRLLEENDKKLAHMGQATVERFLPAS
jgi:hypothetical protein